MLLQWRVGHQSHGFLGQIILGGAKAAGGYHHIRTRESLAQGSFQPLRIIAHRMHLQQIHAKGRELAGHMGGIGVYRMPQQQLCTYRYDFRLHAASGLLTRQCFGLALLSAEHPRPAACSAQDAQPAESGLARGLRLTRRGFSVKHFLPIY